MIILRSKEERRPFTSSTFRKPWRRVLERAGITNFKVHDFRHPTASRAFRGGAELRAVQELLGHKDIKTTVKYLRTTGEQLRRQSKRLPACVGR
jgi:site-specific recombinase XerD